MQRSKKNIMAALLSALAVVLSAIAVAPMTGAWMGRAPDAQIYGTVTDDSSKQPLADVSVHVFNISMSYSNSTLTDANGAYQITMPEGDYGVTMEFTLAGYMTGTQEVQFANESMTADATLVPKASLVNGTVNTGGNAVAGADVLLIGGGGQMNALTDATGAFQFNLPGYDLEYELRVTASGMYGFTERFALPLGAVKTKTVSLVAISGPTSSIWGYVFNSTSSLPIDGARVTFTQRGSDRFIGAVSSSGGYYSVMLPAGFYDVLVESTGYLSFMTGLDVVENANDQQDFMLSPVPVAGIGVTGVVTDSASTDPITGAKVSLIDASGAQNSAITDGSGNYTITTYAGSFTLEVAASGYFVRSEVLVVGTTDIVKDVVLLPVPPQTIMVWGYTKDITAKPVGGVTVTLYDLDASHSGYLSVVTSAMGGYFSITTYPGHFLLVGEAAGFAISAADINPASTQRQDIVLNTLAPRSTGETIVFADWNNISYTADVVTQSTDGTTRWEMDHNFGNGDGTVTQEEADQYLSTIQERGPLHRDTRDFMTVDGIIYKYIEDTYIVTAGNALGPDTNTTPIILHYTYNLSANTSVPQAAFHILEFHAAYNNAESSFKSTLTLPQAYEMRKVVQSTLNVSVNGTTNVTITPLTQLPGAAAGSEKVSINISKNEPPFADTSGNLTVKPGTLVVLDGSTSSDDTSIVNWTWNFGDATSGWGAVVNHTYNITNGTTVNFTVTLSVTDTGGLVNSTTLRVTVDGKQPAAFFSTGNKTVLQNTEPFEVNASGSNDDINISRYLWTWGDLTTSEGVVTNHTYTEAGDFNVTLNVTDAAGNWANSTVTVTVLDNVQPIARFVANVTVSPAGQAVEFNATTSYDNVDITQFLWDFGDNKSTSKVSGNRTEAGVVNHTYSAEGNFNVTLNVTDGRFWNETTITVQITPPLIFADLHVQDISFSKKDPVDGDKIQISVKLSNSGEKAATNFTVRFMDGTKKIKDATVKNIDIGGQPKTITVDWTPKAGKHAIRVIVDALSSVPESNETNNEVTKNITAGPNQMTTYIAIIALVVVVLIVVYYFYSKRRAARAEEEEDEEEEEEEEEDEQEDDEESEEDEEHECPKCFAEVKSSDKKCPSCGANLRR
jgi:PKD repeat protein